MDYPYHPVTPPTLDHLKDAIQLRLQNVETLKPGVDITLENSDLFGDSYVACIEAMRDAAVMAFEFVAGELGVTGFQASVAALQAYGMVAHVEGPFMIVQLRDVLYPQYDPVAKVRDWITSDEDSRKWIIEQAQERLAENNPDQVSPNVWKHWLELAEGDF